MENYLKSLNPKSDNLIYGNRYSLYRDGKYLGVAVWTKDDNVGDSFQTKDERGISTVWIADKWELID